MVKNTTQEHKNCDRKYKWHHYIDHELKKEMWFMITKEGECFNKDFQLIGNLVEGKFIAKEGFIWPETRKQRNERIIAQFKDWHLELNKFIQIVEKEEGISFEEAAKKISERLAVKLKDVERLNKYLR